jgi:hypothetical protein
MVEDQPRRLEGQQLLAALKQLGPDATRSDQAYHAGYYSEADDGRIRYHYAALYQAISEATGVIRDRRSGVANCRRLPWQTTVLTTGACLVGHRYMQELGLEPGDQVTIKRRGRKLVLEPAEPYEIAA